jgi:hypothetical protein
MQQAELYKWGVITTICALVVVLVKTIRRQPIPPIEQFIVLALSVGADMVGLQIIYKAFTDPTLYKVLEWDGTLALVIGGGSTIYLGTKEIIKLLMD